MRRNGPSAFARLRGARGREPLWRSRTTLAHRGCVPDRVGAAVPGHPYRAQAGIGAGVLLDPGAVVPDERGPASRRTRPSTTSGSRTRVPTRGFETPAPRPRSRSRARPKRRGSDRVRPAARRVPRWRRAPRPHRGASRRRGRSRGRGSRAPRPRRSGWGGFRPLRSRRAPVSVPALFGPTRMRPRSSTRASEPHPEPISIMSMTGSFTGSPLPLLNSWTRPTSTSCCLSAVKPRTNTPFAVVRPMSVGGCAKSAGIWRTAACTFGRRQDPLETQWRARGARRPPRGSRVVATRRRSSELRRAGTRRVAGARQRHRRGDHRDRLVLGGPRHCS